MREVYIRGWGLECALGSGSAAAAAGLKTGATSCTPAPTLPWLPPGVPVARAGGVPEDLRSPAEGTQLLARPLAEALAKAGLAAGELAGAAVFHGTTSGFAQDDDRRAWSGRGDPSLPVGGLRSRGWGQVGAETARLADTRGPVLGFSAACASSAAAIAEAWLWIASGRADTAIAVGYETLLNATASGFRVMLLTDPLGPRPFDRDRAGTALGEGCAVVVLSARGPGPRLAGAIARLDATHATTHDPSGAFGEAMLTDLLARCGAATSAVAAVKAHGTATKENDLVESRVLRRTFLDRLPPVVSLKASLGHCLGAAGAVETAAWLACLERGFIPPCAGFSTPDPELGIVPPSLPLPAPAGLHILQFFGFGGSCAALAIEHQEGNA